MNRTIKDWLIILLLLLDDAAALVVVFLLLWFFHIDIPVYAIIIIALILGTLVFILHKAVFPVLHKRKITGAEGMIGLRGKVVEPLTPLGLIKVGDEYWKARAIGGNIAAGEDVEILGLDGLLLIVKPVTNNSPSPSMGEAR